MAILHRGAGVQWDSEVVNAFATGVSSVRSVGAA
jgi:hypothetical protein